MQKKDKAMKQSRLNKLFFKWIKWKRAINTAPQEGRSCKSVSPHHSLYLGQHKFSRLKTKPQQWKKSHEKLIPPCYFQKENLKSKYNRAGQNFAFLTQELFHTAWDETQKLHIYVSNYFSCNEFNICTNCTDSLQTLKAQGVL